MSAKYSAPVRPWYAAPTVGTAPMPRIDIPAVGKIVGYHYPTSLDTQGTCGSGWVTPPGN